MTAHRRVPDARRHPLTQRLAAELAAVICPVHNDAVAANEDGYMDPFTGRWVFTAAYLWDRGSCCESGCRHCPYQSGVRYRADGSVAT